MYAMCMSYAVLIGRRETSVYIRAKKGRIRRHTKIDGDIAGRVGAEYGLTGVDILPLLKQGDSRIDKDCWPKPVLHLLP
jgi:hypothetical protein